MIILNTEKLKSSNLARLDKYVDDGGQLLIYSNSNIKPILEDYFKEKGVGPLLEKEYTDPLQFTYVDRQHPAFNGVFKGETDNKKIFKSPNINKAIYLKGGRELIKVASNSFLNEISVGKGRILYLALKPDLEYSDLPLKGFFPVLNNSLVSYMNSNEKELNDFSNNTSRKLLIEKNLVPDKLIKIIDPNNRELTSNGVELPSGYLFELQDFKAFGNYKILNSNGRVINSISINHDPSESVINELDESYIKLKLSSIIDSDKIQIINERDEFDFNTLKSSTGTELWQLFVLLALLFAIIEMLIQKVYKSEIT